MIEQFLARALVKSFVEVTEMFFGIFERMTITSSIYIRMKFHRYVPNIFFIQ